MCLFVSYCRPFVCFCLFLMLVLFRCLRRCFGCFVICLYFCFDRDVIVVQMSLLLLFVCYLFCLFWSWCYCCSVVFVVCLLICFVCFVLILTLLFTCHDCFFIVVVVEIVVQSFKIHAGLLFLLGAASVTSRTPIYWSLQLYRQCLRTWLFLSQGISS